MIPAELVAAYRATRYRVLSPTEPFVLRVDIFSPPMSRLYQKHAAADAAFITACNPFSGLRDGSENEHAQNELRTVLEAHGCILLDGIGEDLTGRWAGEPSFLALNLQREDAEQIGRRFEQNALIWAGGDAIPRLILLR